MALSLEQFVHYLTDSGLMTEQEVSAISDSLPEAERPQDAEALAKKLVAENKLTPFQAQQLWKGKGKSLTLGDYVVSEKIGAGGMGMVFKAQHRLMKREVALKVLPPSVTKDENAVARFLREVEAAAKLTHRNIVTAHDAGESNGAYYLIMECVEGRDLSAIVKKQGPATVVQAIDFTLQTARGLEYAHKNGVIHRDIKPANLLLDKDGTVKILDMGLARIEDDSIDASTQAGLTGTGTIMGTVDYMSPEQAVDTKSAGPQADIYSLGASLYYLLTAKPVVAGDTMGKKLQKLMTGRGLPESISAERNEVPASLDAVFCKMTAFEMADRYQSMTEVIADLEAVQAGDVPSSASSAGIAPVATGRSEESAMNSFLEGLDDGASPSAKTVATAQKPSTPSDTFSSSVGEMTRPVMSQTIATRKGSTNPQQRKLLIGGAVAGVVLVGALIWGFSGGEPAQSDAKPAATVPKNQKPVEHHSELKIASDNALAFQDDTTNVICRSVILDRTAPHTLEAWVRVRDHGGNILSFLDGTFPRLNFHGNQEGLVFERENYKGLRTNKMPYNEWCHVAGVQDYDEIRLYLNGTLQLRRDVPPVTKKNSFARRLLIGGKMNFFGEFNGDIDEVRISSTARYSKPFTPKRQFENDGSTLALYHFDEGEGAILRDTSGNGHNGFIQGAIWTTSGSATSPFPPVISPASDSPNAPPLAVAPFDEAKAKAHQKAWADYLGEPVETTNSIGMKFVVIPPGKFKMGEDENIVDVTLTNPFRFGVHEVTQGQWKSVMGTEPWKGQENIKEGTDIAVSYVNWEDATEFCSKLTEREQTAGRIHGEEKYRLPTEAEWEHACRAGTTTIFSFGNDESQLEDYAWYKGNALDFGEPYAHSVALKKPNSWGLYDSYGNVWEWCSDWIGETLSGGIDPLGQTQGTDRLNRGGCWNFQARGCRSAFRNSSLPSRRSSYLGFRVVRDSASSAPLSVSYDAAYERAAAKFMLDAGAEVTIAVGGQDQKLTSGASLPSGDFVVTSIVINKPNYSTGVDDPITGNDLQRIARLSGIKQIQLYWINLGDSALQHLADLNSLEELKLVACGISNEGLKTIGQMTHLKNLNLGYNNPQFMGGVDGTGLIHLTNLRGLTDLNLLSCQIDDAGTAHLKSLTNLRNLSLYQTLVTDAALPNFYSLRHLTTLETDKTVVTKDGLDAFWAKHKELKSAGTSAADAPPPTIAPFNEAKAKAHQKAWAEFLGLPVEKEIELSGGEKMSFMLIPPGEFMMGSSEEEKQLARMAAKATGGSIGAMDDEAQKHLVKIAQPFYLSQTETTQAQWEALTGMNPSTKVGPDYPVENISWDDVQKFLNSIDQKVLPPRMNLAFPSEEQWEYACRAGTKSYWYCGIEEAKLHDFEWFNGKKSHNAVATLKPNPWGLFDMNGNVKEWCSNRPGLFRGGSHAVPGWNCRSATRGMFQRDFRGGQYGIRFAMAIDREKLKTSQTSTSQADRAAALHVLRSGGYVTVIPQNRRTPSITVRTIEELPVDPFALQSVYFTNVAGITDESLQPFSGLTHLTFVFLHNTNVTDKGIQHLKSCPRLENINLYGTKVTDKGLLQLADLPRLRHLSLIKTPAESTGLEGLSGLKSLDQIYVSEDLTKERVIEFAHVSQLREIVLSNDNPAVTVAVVEAFHLINPHCRIRTLRGKAIGRDPVLELAKWVQSIGGTVTLNVIDGSDGYETYSTEKPLPTGAFTIREISLANCTKLTNDGLARITAAPSLHQLDLHKTSIDDDGIAQLANCRALALVWLNNTAISDHSLEILSQLPRLTELQLRGTKITNAGLKHLLIAKRLRWLDAGNEQITGESLNTLNKLEQLETLNLNGTDIVDDNIQQFAPLNNLRILTLIDTELSATGANELSKLLPRCRISYGPEDKSNVVHPENQSKADRAAAEWVLEMGGIVTVKTKEEIVVSSIDELPATEFQLTKINLQTNDKVLDTDIKQLEKLENLSQVDLGNTNIGDEGLKHLKSLPKLRLLAIGGTQVSDKGLEQLENMDQLQYLSLTATQVSDAGLVHLLGLTGLRTLRLSRTKVTAENVATLRKALPDCEIDWDASK